MSTPFEFLNSSIRIAPGRRVVPAEDFNRFSLASEILDKAKEEAVRIEAEAAEAYEERRLEGYRDGIAQANDEKAVFCFQVAQDFSQVVHKIEEKLSSLFPQIVRNLLGDIGEELSFKSYISRALQDLVSEEKLTIKVHSSRRILIEEHVESLKKSDGNAFKFIRVSADNTLEVDQATIETSSSIVVLDLQRQLELLKEYAVSRLSEVASAEALIAQTHTGVELTQHVQLDERAYAELGADARQAQEQPSSEVAEEEDETPFRMFD